MTITMVKQMRIFYGLLVMFSLTLSGCGVFFGDDGYFRNREDDYLKADKLPPMEVPANLNKDAPGELYQVPELTQDDINFVEDTEHFSVPRPRSLSVNALVERVKIQRLGEERWILVNVQPGQLWPQVSNFLSSNQLRVAGTDIDKGLLETGWVSFDDENSRVHRFRIRIDKGVQPDTSEIHVLHMGVERAEAPEVTGWPDESMSTEREHWLVDALAQQLATEELAEGGGTSLVAQAIGGQAKSEVSMQDGEPVLRLQLNRARALATISHAVQQQGFVTFDSDIDAGVFFLGYQKPSDESPGWFGKMLGRGKPKPPPTSRYSLSEVLAPLSEPYDSVSVAEAAEAERSLPLAEGYLLIVTQTEAGVFEARLRSVHGQRIPPRQAREMLSVIRQNLI